jgi:predicted 3-demethylubiquinone-9 3-methyltransferase (glyoxalase superfamily)
MDTNTQVRPVETLPAAKAKKPIYKRWWAIALAAVFVIGGISQAMGGGDDAKPVADKPAASAPVEKKSEPKAQEPVEEAPEMTAGQENALQAAENYLSMMPFSRTGLIRQLSSESGDGYSVKDATFAVNHLTVDWNEQAAKAAKNYLDTMPFSRSGLIRQLSSEAGDGYTHAQAVYGVNKAGL